MQCSDSRYIYARCPIPGLRTLHKCKVQLVSGIYKDCNQVTCSDRSTCMPRPVYKEWQFFSAFGFMTGIVYSE